MSLTLLAVVSLNCSLKTDDLNRYAEELALPVAITHETDLRTHSGFLSAELNGEKSGVETSYDQSTEGLMELPNFEPSSAQEIGLVAFRWGSDFQEGAVGFYLAYALGKKCGAEIVDTESGSYMTLIDTKFVAQMMMETE